VNWPPSPNSTARRETQEHADGVADAELDPRVLSAGEALIEEIAAALTVTGNAATALMHTARQLARCLPGTRAALETGRIDLAKARIICDATEGLPDHTAAVLETAVLERAPRQTTGQLRRRIKTLARRLAPDAFDDQVETTFQKRRVELWEDSTGTASLALLDITSDDAHAIHNKLTAAARAVRAESRAQDGHEGDTRTLDQIRADLATRLLRGHPLPEAVAALLKQAYAPAPPGAGPRSTPPVPDVPNRSLRSRSGDPDPNGGLRRESSIPDTPSALHDQPSITLLAHGALQPSCADQVGQSDGEPAWCASDVTPIDDRQGVTWPDIPDEDLLSTQGAADALPPEKGEFALKQHAVHADPISALGTDIERQLSQVKARLRATGRLDQLRESVTGVLSTLHQALTPFRDTWCPTDEQGRHGYPGYRPPAHLRRIIQARHSTCVFPTCNRQVQHCDLDHTIAYDAHGPTCGCNLAPLCRRHHRLKQRQGWYLYQPWPGLLIWITPSGTWHIVRPE
jgi:Domain of unknown function (DUF222)